MKPGDKLGPYEILAPIGAGGMGEAYKASDTKLDREVAIKVLPFALAQDPDRLARFEREAKVLASLNHPNIAQIYGIEESSGVRALVMELVPGETLKGPLPLESALNYAKQIADALEAAHEKGITHRDLKPANVMITPAGVVKVLDFGLAAVGQPSTPGDGNPTNSPTMTMAATQAGMIMGTTGYMSPEQAAGQTVDKRADIWAFGVVLWEMLTGKQLFQGTTISHILASVLKDEPNFMQVPPKVRRLLQRCLEKDQKKRLRDIGDAMELVQADAEAAPASSTVPSPSRNGRLWPIVAAVAIAIAAAMSFLHFREQPEERQVLQYALTPPEKAGEVRYFAISPDGHYIVMVAGGDGPQLWIRALDSLQSQPLVGTENATFPFWSPDSRYIGFFAQEKLKKIAVSGGPAQTLCDAPVARGGAWGRDGVIVFTPDNGNNGLKRVSAAGGVAVPVTKNVGGGTHRWPMFLPDGRRFLYMANGGNTNGIHLKALDADEDRRLVPDESNPEYLAPVPGRSIGYLLFVREQTLMAQPVDRKTLETKGELFPVAEQILRGGSNGSNLYSISDNGILILQSGGGGAGNQHVWFDRNGKELGKLGGVVRSRGSLGLSPEGKRVAIEHMTASQGSDLWITDMEHSGTETRLTFDASSNSYPVWSPDGSKVAFASNRRGTYNLYQRAANGTGQDELLFESQESKQPTDWSRDGRFIIFRSNNAGAADDLWALPVAGSSGGQKQSDQKPIPLVRTPFRETQGQLSPDGRWLAYSSTESGVYQVYVQPFAPGFDKPMTGKWQISPGGGMQPRWRADGRELFNVAQDRKLMAVDVKATAQTFDRSAPQSLFEAPPLPQGVTGAFNWLYAPSADGKRFLFIVPEGALSAVPPLTVVVNWQAGLKK